MATEAKMPSGETCVVFMYMQIIWFLHCKSKRCGDVEPTASGRLKFHLSAEGHTGNHLSLHFLYRFRLAIGYCGPVKGGRVSSPRFLGGLRGWGSCLVFS
jgi:hypothetical protein